MRDILIRARELIADPEHWVQGSYAENNDGSGAYLFDPERPYCLCLIGAVDRATFELSRGRLNFDLMSEDAKISFVERHTPAGDAIEHLQQFVPGLVSDFNDEHEHAEVIGLLDKAIEALPA